VIIALIAVSTIAVSGAFAVRALIAGVAQHLEADDIPLSARPSFRAQPRPQPQRRALAARSATASRVSDASLARIADAYQRQAAA
jgi:hypothetical protein